MANQLTVMTDENGRRYIPDYFIYRTPPTSLAASASATAQISINAEGDFVLTKMSYAADVAGAAQTDSSRVIPLVNVSLTDSGSGRNLQNFPVPISTMAGSEGLPFNLPVPRVFKANSNLSITFTNSSAATTYNVTLCLIGYNKLYL